MVKWLGVFLTTRGSARNVLRLGFYPLVDTSLDSLLNALEVPKEGSASFYLKHVLPRLEDLPDTMRNRVMTDVLGSLHMLKLQQVLGRCWRDSPPRSYHAVADSQLDVCSSPR